MRLTKAIEIKILAMLKSQRNVNPTRYCIYIEEFKDFTIESKLINCSNPHFKHPGIFDIDICVNVSSSYFHHTITLDTNNKIDKVIFEELQKHKK